jgi:Lon protease-like protein
MTTVAQPMFPLESAALPGDALPLRIFEPRYSQLVRDCLALADPAFGTVLITRGREVGGGDIRGDVGVLAHITTSADHGNGQYELRTAIRERIRVLEWLPDDPYPRAVVELWPDEPGPSVSSDRIAEVAARIRELYTRVAEARGARIRADALTVDKAVVADPVRHVYALAAQLPMGQADRYAVLAAPGLAERIAVLIDAIETVEAMVEFQLSEE